MPQHCYLLCSNTSSSSSSSSNVGRGRSYIGYTTHPRRRLRQHNKDIKGGAVRTARALNWRHVCIVSDFPNQQSKTLPLILEWQWAHASKTRMLKGIVQSQSTEANHHHHQQQQQQQQQQQLQKLMKKKDHKDAECKKQLVILEDKNKAFFDQVIMTIAQDRVIRIRTAIVTQDDIDVMYKPSESRKQMAGSSACSLCNEEFSLSSFRYWTCTCGISTHTSCLSTSANARGDHPIIPTEYSCCSCARHYRWIEIVKNSSILSNNDNDNNNDNNNNNNNDNDTEECASLDIDMEENVIENNSDDEVEFIE